MVWVKWTTHEEWKASNRGECLGEESAKVAKRLPSEKVCNFVYLVHAWFCKRSATSSTCSLSLSATDAYAVAGRSNFDP